MFGLTKMFVSEDKKSLLDFTEHIYQALGTNEERTEAYKYAAEALKDGSVTVTEWTTLGKKLGVFRKGVTNANGKR